MDSKKILSDTSLGLEESTEGVVPMIFPEDGDFDYNLDVERLPDELPLIPLRNFIVFPSVTVPVMVGRDKTKRLLRYLEKAPDKHVLLVTQKENDVEDPGKEDLVPVGTVGEVLRVMQVQDDLLTIIVQGKRKAEIKAMTGTVPFWKGTYRFIEESKPNEGDLEYSALVTNISEATIKMLMHKGDLPQPVARSIAGIRNPESLVNFACTHFPTDLEEKLSWLFINDIKTRAYQLLAKTNQVLQFLEMKALIQQRTKSDLDQQQKDYFLQQQMRIIREELQETDEEEIEELLSKGKKMKWPKEVCKTFQKEVKKLQRTNTQSPDYSVQMQYLQTMLDLPWDRVTKDNFNLSNASRVLDRDHFGMEKVKERILEHLAVLKLKGDLRAPIICLYGPPGVGKTSLGRSIATALNRAYVRISLGGLHDEAEIRGHRRTYIGAMPGRIIKGFIRAGSANPVFVLDELDKLAQDYKGDPASALLEVLDPEQNNTFHDNYLDIDYDLSKALFIATANHIGNIPSALRDRMEMIEVSGYLIEEKVEIARKHLLPKALADHGLTSKQVKVGKKTLEKLIEDYTRESGVRELEKRIASLLRKIAKKVADSEDSDSNQIYDIKPKDLPELLGPHIFSSDQYEGNQYAGVVTGLAWTSVGGEILLIESAISPSRNGKMSITGNLGDVMKESAILALEYIKSHCNEYNIPSEVFDYWNVHIHVPEGAIPKDGPSAGITLVTSLISTFTQRKVCASVAMTGEITLRGKVLPVGGIKEKILAAKRSGIKTIILCKENEKDVKEIKDTYVKGLTFVYVNDIKEVIEAALTKNKVDNPIDLMKQVTQLKKATQTSISSQA